MRTSGKTKAASVAKRPRQRSKQDAAARDADWNDSIALMMLSTANFWRRSGNAYYRDLFGISITEVAILSLLDARAPLTLNAIADHCGIDKTQMSRSVKDLVQRKLVRQNKSPRHGSELEISLDKDGKRLCERLKPATTARFETLLAALTPRQVDLLGELLARLFRSAKTMALKENASRRLQRGR
jgi:MarR family transcriptional regulator, temperature-dependent positive regulator of motility